MKLRRRSEQQAAAVWINLISTYFRFLFRFLFLFLLLLHQVSWPAILDLKSVGTGPSSRPILLLFRGNFFCFSSGVFEILESDLFQDNFSMALYSFGGVNDQCSVTSWAVQETGMLPLLSCDSDMTAWLKHK